VNTFEEQFYSVRYGMPFFQVGRGGNAGQFRWAGRGKTDMKMERINVKEKRRKRKEREGKKEKGKWLVKC
jgi:hypothetical protein